MAGARVLNRFEDTAILLQLARTLIEAFITTNQGVTFVDAGLGMVQALKVHLSVGVQALWCVCVRPHNYGVYLFGTRLSFGYCEGA